MFQAKFVEKIPPQFLFNNLFLESRALFEIMWKNIVRQNGPQIIIRRMRFVCWITKNTEKQTQSMLHLLIFQGNKAYTNASSSAFIRKLHVMFSCVLFRTQLITGL